MRGAWAGKTDVVACAFVAALAGLLVLIGTQGSLVLVVVAVGLALGALALVGLGLERTALACLMVAFFTAPFYKGAAPSPGSPVTATDVGLLVGFVLLVPRMFAGRLQIPAGYLLAVTGVFATTLVASVLSASPTKSLVGLVFWMTVMVGLPIAFSLWRPSERAVDLLAMTFVAGQIFSLAVGTALGKSGQGRAAGLSTQPNYLGQGTIFSIALLLYLWPRYRQRSLAWSVTLAGSGVIVVLSLILSGSRAATLVGAALLLMVAVVERSVLLGALTVIGAGLVLVSLPILVSNASTGSSISRLAGGDGSQYATQARTQGLHEGLARFADHPLTGSGLIDLFDIHNNYVEVLVASGVLGLAAYLVVLFYLGRPLFGDGEHRRLSYAAWAYIGFGATVPSLYDRGVWVVLALAATTIWARDVVPRAERESRLVSASPSPLPHRES